MRIEHLFESKKNVDFQKLMKDFLPVAMEIIGLKTLPDFKLELRINDDDQPTFGKFVNEEDRIYLALEDRHPLDILRTLAHELVHYQQKMDHKLGPESGQTGSPEENEAHQVAGIVMREFNRRYRQYFNEPAINLRENAAPKYTALEWATMSGGHSLE